MALSRLTYNSLNVTPTASKGIGFDSGADDLSIDFAGGSITFIKKLTSDGSDDDLSFVDGTSDVVLDSTYKEYMFIFNNIHPETTEDFMWQCNAAGGADYNETITSTTFETYHQEDDGGTPAVGYDGGRDQAQGTAFHPLANNIQNDNDSGGAGYLHLFNPSSTTFVTHFIGTMTYMNGATTQTIFSAGYVNTTSAIDEVQFKMESGEIQGGTISLYGIN